MDVLSIVVIVVLALAAIQLAFRLAAGRGASRVRGRPLPDDPLFAVHRERPAFLIYFFSPRCAACRRMFAVLRRIADRGYPLVEVDVSRHAGSAKALGVLATPTTIVVRDGLVFDSLIGTQSEAVLAQALGAASPD